MNESQGQKISAEVWVRIPAHESVDLECFMRFLHKELHRQSLRLWNENKSLAKDFLHLASELRQLMDPAHDQER